MGDNKARGGDHSEGEGRDCDSRQKTFLAQADAKDRGSEELEQARDRCRVFFTEDFQREYWERLGGCYEPSEDT
jgi:hypothetical protein